MLGMAGCSLAFAFLRVPQVLAKATGDPKEKLPRPTLGQERVRTKIENKHTKANKQNNNKQDLQTKVS